MNNELFAYYFENIKYHIQSGKGISIFNADDNLFFSFLTQVKATNRKRVVFKSSDYLKDGKLPNIDDTIDFVLIYQDVDIIDLQKFIDPFVNKLVYPAFYKNKSICFFSKNDADDYNRKQITSGTIHTDLQKVFNFLFIEQLIDLIDQVNYKFSSPRFIETSWEKTIYTPIEQIMKEALEKKNIFFTPQVKLGRFCIDFLVESNNQKIIVECDGREYHNPYRDKERDKELSKEHYRIIHFTGSEIYTDIDSCIEKIEKISSTVSSKEYPIDEDLKKDESQLRTLDFITGLIRVLAPAGSGKTKTLINRIAQLLNKGIEPNSILALVFNKKAADEMKQRLKSKGIPVAEHFTRDEGVTVQTFHAFGYEIVRNKLNSRFDGHNVVKTTRKLLKELFAL